MCDIGKALFQDVSFSDILTECIVLLYHCYVYCRCVKIRLSYGKFIFFIYMGIIFIDIFYNDVPFMTVLNTRVYSRAQQCEEHVYTVMVPLQECRLVFIAKGGERDELKLHLL